MAANSTVQITFDWNNPDLEPEESDEQVQRLMTALDDLEEVEVHRVPDPHPPKGRVNPGVGF